MRTSDLPFDRGVRLGYVAEYSTAWNGLGMADHDQSEDHLSPQEMRDWLAQEIKDSAKAHELRVKEARAFVTAYASGEITGEEAMRRMHQYDRRWGEALYGAMSRDDATDKSILEQIDRARAESTATAKFRRRLTQNPSENTR